MKKHNGMRPLDIVVLLKITALGQTEWKQKDLAYSLGISASEVSESLSRSELAGLIDEKKQKVMARSLYEFLFHGFKYVYPQRPGAITLGMPTAISAPAFSSIVTGKDTFVWPDPEGTIRGQTIEPLYDTVPGACRKDQLLYELLALTDIIRIGRVREVEAAGKELRKRLTIL